MSTHLNALVVAVAVVVQPSSTLSREISEIAGRVPGRVGASVLLLETGEAAGLNEAERFPMQSVYKLPIAMAILDQVERRAMTLNEKVHLGEKDMVPAGAHSPIRDAHPHGGIEMSLQDLIRAAIVDSDGTASDVLFRVGGGGARLTAYLRGIGVKDMVIAATEAAMAHDNMVQYRNYATPGGAMSLLKALHAGRGVSPDARTMLLRFLIETETGPARLKGLLPAGTIVAHKTGTDGTHDGLTRATNDIGIVTLPDGRHVALAVFVKDSTADEKTRERTIAQIARAAWDHWNAGHVSTPGAAQ